MASGIDRIIPQMYAPIYGEQLATAFTGTPARSAGTVGGLEPRTLNTQQVMAQVERTAARRVESGQVDSSTVPAVSTAVESPQLARVDSNTAKNIFINKPVSQAAKNYNSFTAASGYTPSNINSGEYDGLRSFKSQEVASAASNPFASLSAGADYTSGLSFAGVNSLDPNRFNLIG